MFKIMGKQNLSLNVRRLDILCEDLVSFICPGHFIALAVDEKSQRIPMRVFDVDQRRRCLSIIIEENNDEMRRLGALKIHESLYAISGPFGKPIPIIKRGTIVCVAQGRGLISMVQLCRSFKNVGNKVIGVVAFESRKSSFFEQQIRVHCASLQAVYQNNIFSYQELLTAPFRQILEKEDVGCVYIDASLQSVKEIALIASQKNIPVFYNMFDYVQTQPLFHEKMMLQFQQEYYFPVVEGVFVDSTYIDPAIIENAVDHMKGYVECHRQKIESLRQKNVWVRLKKFIWG